MAATVKRAAVAGFMALLLGIAYSSVQELTVWTNIVPGDVTRAPALAEIIAEFERLNPDIRVMHDAFGFEEHSTSVKLAVQGGTGPDVLMSQVGADAQDRYFRDGLLVDLAPIAVERGWIDRYEPWVLAFPNLAYDDSDVWDGPQLAVIPAYMNLLGIYYNRDMFDRLGLSAPTTWEEFEHVIVTLKDNGITPFAFGNLERFHFLHMAWAAMHASTPPERVKDWYYMIDPDVRLTDADFVRGLAWLQSLATDGYVNPDFNAVSREDLYNMLYSGDFGMVVLGTWALRRFATEAPFEVGFFPIPMMDADMTRGIVGDMGWGFAILADSDQQDAAIRFLDFTTSEFAAEAWYRHSNIPAMKLPADDVEPAYALQGEFYRETQDLVIGQFMDTAAPGLRTVAEVEGQRLMSGLIEPEDWARAAQEVFEEWGRRIGRLP
jgi:raffinose/stachyose/melibiose transport system substrate-binding protein